MTGINDTMSEAGLKAAEAYAGWYLGSRSWAHSIIHAYLHPEETMERLEREQAQYEKKP